MRNEEFPPPKKNRAFMIRTCSLKQLTIAEFDWPFVIGLDQNNRWAKLNQCISWDELAESYYQVLATEQRGLLSDWRRDHQT